MGFSITRSIRDVVARDRPLSIGSTLWSRITRQLARRTDGRHESGAFLLGIHEGARRRIVDVLYYDDVDPGCLATGIVVFNGRRLSRVWRYCREHTLAVVADVHVHPGRAQQSLIDRRNPMIREVGHIALILADYVRSSDRAMGMFTYLGSEQWRDEDPSRFYRGPFG